MMKNGFTLAEVLITLGIIGVAAAMTMPVLIAKQRDAVLVAQLKKTYSVFSQVVYELNYEYGGDWNNINLEQFGDDLTARIKNVRVCRRTAGCLDWGSPLYLKGGQAGNWNSETTYKFTLPDGTFARVRKYSDPLLKYEQECDFEIIVDVNGNKKPNKIGRDIFYFGVRDGKLIPAGIDEQSASCGNDIYGYTCAWKVLTEGKFNY